MSRNELGDGIAVDTGWFQMLWQHSNTIYGKSIGCVCGELWYMWYRYVTEKKWNLGGGTGCQADVDIRGQSLCGIWSGKYWLGVHHGKSSSSGVYYKAIYTISL